jgi:hypothetical protein
VAELLRYLTARSQALPSGHHDGCNKRHTLLLRSVLLYRVLAGPQTRLTSRALLRMALFCNAALARRREMANL